MRSLLPPMLRTVTMLFGEEAWDIIKSTVSFVRFAVVALSPAELEPLLPETVRAMMSHGKGKERFRQKIKIILKKLVRLYGYDAVKASMSEDDVRLLTHMRKVAERTSRRNAERRADGGDDDARFDDMMGSDEEDSDDGRTLMTGVTGFTKLTARSGKSLRSAAQERSEKRSAAKSKAGSVYIGYTSS